MYGPHDVSRSYAQPGEVARCKTCGLVFDEAFFRPRRKMSNFFLLFALLLLIAEAVGYMLSVDPSGLFIGGIFTFIAFVFGAAGRDEQTILSMHARGAK